MLDPTSFEEPACPLCGSQQRETVVRFSKAPPYGVVQCRDCELAYLSPRPTETQMLELYRADDYFASSEDQGYQSYEAQQEPLRRTFRRLLETLARTGHTGGSLLEVGCGYGYLLDEARPFFSRRVGTDFSAGAVEVARSRADEVFVGPAEAAGTGPFDVIITNHVIEHVYDPVGFVRSLAARCRPGGTIVVSTPDFGSAWRRAMGVRWPSYKLPEHVLYFAQRTLKRTLEAAGLERLAPVPYPHAFPLPLVAEKLHLKLPAAFGRYNLWIPATTVAMLAHVPMVASEPDADSASAPPAAVSSAGEP